MNKIAFTGSAAVGKAIVKMAADTVKRVTLELGGKSPNIFFADADFEAAIDGALFGVFINQGEVCSAGSRILVEKPIYSKFVEAMAAKAKTHPPGPAARARNEDGTAGEQGAVRPRSRLSGNRQEGSETGCGRRARRSILQRGYYVEPTIFYDVDNSARIAREEIFGPVAAVIPFRRRSRRHSHCQRYAVWPGCGGLVARYFQSFSRGEGVARRNRLGESHAAHIRRSALGRLQAVRLRPRARSLGHRRVSRDQAGPHQSERTADRMVLSMRDDNSTANRNSRTQDRKN